MYSGPTHKRSMGFDCVRAYLNEDIRPELQTHSIPFETVETWYGQVLVEMPKWVFNGIKMYEQAIGAGTDFAGLSVGEFVSKLALK